MQMTFNIYLRYALVVFTLLSVSPVLAEVLRDPEKYGFTSSLDLLPGCEGFKSKIFEYYVKKGASTTDLADRSNNLCKQARWHAIDGKFDAALKDTDQALAVDAKNGLIFRTRAMIFDESGDEEAAEKELNSLISFQPKYIWDLNFERLNVRALWFELHGRNAESLREINKLVSDRQDTLLGLKYRAKFYERHNQLDLALSDRQRLMESDPENETLSHSLLLLKLNRDKEAESEILAARRNPKTNWSGSDGTELLRLLLEKNKAKIAENIMTSMGSADSQLISIAGVYQQLGREEDSARVLKRAVQNDSNSPLLLFTLAMLKKKAGCASEATHFLKKCVASSAIGYEDVQAQAALELGDTATATRTVYHEGLRDPDGLWYLFFESNGLPIFEKIFAAQGQDAAVKTLSKMEKIRAHWMPLYKVLIKGEPALSTELRAD